jgi:hypothetical protein
MCVRVSVLSAYLFVWCCVRVCACACGCVKNTQEASSKADDDSEGVLDIGNAAVEADDDEKLQGGAAGQNTQLRRGLNPHTHLYPILNPIDVI